MMEITRESDYAVRCVLYLAGKRDRIAIIEEIAREMDVPRSFLAKILQKLARASIVKSFRGIKGGFQLARSPGDITLLDVIEAAEGEIALNKCVLDGASCERTAACSVHPVWVKIRRDFRDVLKRYTFDRLKARLQ